MDSFDKSMADMQVVIREWAQCQAEANYIEKYIGKSCQNEAKNEVSHTCELMSTVKEKQEEAWKKILLRLRSIAEANPAGMTLREYQAKAALTAVYPNQGSNPIYPALGLAEEAGEVAGKVKRIIRDDGGTLTESRKAELVKEVGDVMWYVAAMCSELGVGMDEVSAANLAKLQDRKERGALHGKGDAR